MQVLTGWDCSRSRRQILGWRRVTPGARPFTPSRKRGRHGFPEKKPGQTSHLHRGHFGSTCSQQSSSVRQGFPGGSSGEESACSAGDQGLIPGLGRSPGEESSYPLQHSDLENSTDCNPWGHKESDMTERIPVASPLHYHCRLPVFMLLWVSHSWIYWV